jgi:hypothetical protein
VRRRRATPSRVTRAHQLGARVCVAELCKTRVPVRVCLFARGRAADLSEASAALVQSHVAVVAAAVAAARAANTSQRAAKPTRATPFSTP